MLLRVLIGLVALGALCLAYGSLVERRWYRLDRRLLDILPAGAPGPISVLHLSDLHVLAGDRSLARFLASLPRPDVTVVDGRTYEVSEGGTRKSISTYSSSGASGSRSGIATGPSRCSRSCGS